jgi:hypothetical protein
MACPVGNFGAAALLAFPHVSKVAPGRIRTCGLLAPETARSGSRGFISVLISTLRCASRPMTARWCWWPTMLVRCICGQGVRVPDGVHVINPCGDAYWPIFECVSPAEKLLAFAELSGVMDPLSLLAVGPGARNKLLGRVDVEVIDCPHTGSA